MIISLDTETTGLDIVHGARPFLVTWCEQGQGPCFIEWEVDPLTRRVNVIQEDVAYLIELLDAADTIYLHNAKFDCRMLATVGIILPWPKVRDTLIASHLLRSNGAHNLTDLCDEYLGVKVQHYEDTIEEVTRACRKIVKQNYPNWRIAEVGLLDMPSVKASSKRDEDKAWKADMWLSRALLRELYADLQIEEESVQLWLTACSKYACSDSEYTLPLGLEMERIIHKRGLWKIYEHRLHLPRVYGEMESYGVGTIGEYTELTIRDYQEYTVEAASIMCDIAAEYGHKLDLADGAALNDNMREFFYGSIRQRCPTCKYDKPVKHWNGERVVHEYCPKCAAKKRKPVNVRLVTTERDNLSLKIVLGAKTRNATLDKDALQEYTTTLDGTAQEFCKLLQDKRKHDTDLSYMESYRKFWVPVIGWPGYYRIHPSLNPCGTDHLRAASNSPNMQNVSVQEEGCEECDGEGCGLCNGTGKARLSVRRCFGPAPDREWWDFDFKNLEKRIPVYECGEESLIEVFEKPDEPPYWGSDHNVLASLLFPEEYWPLAEVRDGFKKKHLTKYKLVKNTNFAKQYGAGKRKVDATAGVVGAYELIERGLPKIAGLQAHYLSFAQRNGYVETLPDRTVDQDKGYPILASRTEDGRVLSTTPFNYHVSGTACWVKNTALVRCTDQCAVWRTEGFDANVSLEVHDSILFDFPRGRDANENRWRAEVLRGLMEQGGENLVPRIPTPVSVSYHTGSWAEEDATV